MTHYSGPRVFLAGIATAGLTIAASLSGLPAGLFLGGVFGGGALAAAYLAIKHGEHQTESGVEPDDFV